ncbi:MAG: histidine kinase [Mogibacterium sp.]|nr:histidine kinase [Mogibacterium sp.]
MESVIRSGISGMFLTLPILIGMTFTVVNDPYLQKRHRQIMLNLIAICAILVVQNYTESMLSYAEPDPSLILLRTFVSVAGYSLRPVVIVLFFYITKPDRKYTLAWILTAANAAIHSTAFFSHICFWIDDQNHYQRGALSGLGLYVSIILLAYYLYLTFRTYNSVRKREMFVPVLNVLVIIISVLIDYEDGADRPVTYLTVAIVISSLFSYIWLHLRFAEVHVADLEAEQRLNIMMSQMQPHFLFNTLATIQVLCKTDPNEASRVTKRFGKYLRQNMESLEKGTKIDFDKELEHTLNYAEIERARFPNIRIETDIQDRDFSLPALTVQPMVENAIRHGVRIRDDGVIKISSRNTGQLHEVTISDNGKGFDPEELEGKEGLHLGIRNVRERIERMCGGSLEIQSTPGTGTTVIIRIPLAS